MKTALKIAAVVLLLALTALLMPSTTLVAGAEPLPAVSQEVTL